MIGKGDEYPLHQTPEPVGFVSTRSSNFYDRFFFNGFDRDGEVFFAVAFGTYPNRGVVDAAFSVLHDGRQRTIRASRAATRERLDLQVGPIRVEILEPLRRLRVLVEPNPWQLSADLVFEGRAGVIEEPRFRREHKGYLFLDYSRMTQHTTVRGVLGLRGREIRVEPGRFWGTRDRSWGIRPLGGGDPEAPELPLQFYWLWAPVHFEDLCTHFAVNEDERGGRWHQGGAVVRVGGEPESCAAVDYRLGFRKGTRRVSSATLVLATPSRGRLEIELEPVCEFSMSALGYLHPEWGHGMFVGDNVVDGEEWELSEVDPTAPLHWHVQALCRARCGNRQGVGVLEQLFFGPHEPSGFRELYDPAS
ncbi:MAG: hypothetical protein KatS3mg076_2410 [Candidatus Binatia bacterium]|nr:MAG: hypothetical protein KatS3mg076_2410 [Candidatus Binatia bacterium]